LRIRLNGDGDAGVLELRKATHRAVSKVAEEIEGLRFNRAVAHIYELANALAKFQQTHDKAITASQLEALGEGIERLVQLVAPMMPHLAETCWDVLGKEGLVADAAWPEVDPALLVED
jgi:leucyl-tRNA synthetase